jgi:N-acetylglucosaminyldiphosphoundecaprenol N-acetyl-beta-D-mannosaminyltransferase
MRRELFGVPITCNSWKAVMKRILLWAAHGESRSVGICNVHVVVTAARDAAYRALLEGNDINTPDGAPVAWLLRRKGVKGQVKISGPDLTWRLCSQAEKRGVAVYFYGSGEQTLARLEARLREAFPRLPVFFESPPFRELNDVEKREAVQRIHQSGAGIVFVGLGCPKQERWMAEHRGKIGAVMIGVGAAFDFHAGVVSRSPRWMSNAGLEWLHRLCSEPGRLWRRYLVTNTLFCLLALREFFRERYRV